MAARRAGTALVVAILVLGASGARPRLASGAAVDPTGPGTIRLEANCLDLCTVTVLLSGNGSGSWQSTNSAYVPNGLINCVWLNGLLVAGSDCTQVYGGVDRASPFRLYYKITPSFGSEGCLEGTCGSNATQNSTDLPSFPGPTSTILSASFRLLKYPVGVLVAGTGNGSVTSAPGGISCPSFCAADFLYGTPIILTAAAAPGSFFDHWSGACLGQDSTCNLSVTGLLTSTATFTLGSPPTASPPAPTPTAPAATPKATVKPTGTPHPSATGVGAPTTAPSITAKPTGPVGSLAATLPPASNGVPETAAPASIDPATSSGPSSPASTELPEVPAGTSGSDLTPIVLAILGAGLLIAIGIGFAAVMLRRKSPPPA